MSVSWHVDATTIDAYVGGRIDDTAAFSLEAHVLACETCRRALASHTDPDARRRSWAAVQHAIERPRVGTAERSLVAVGLPSHVARLLVATPALRASWLVAVALCVAFATFASRAVSGSPLPFLVLAPLVPLAGVAMTFGRPADPLWEVGLAAPFGGFRLMLLRTAAVLGVSISLAGVGALALADDGWIAVAWLLPALALTLLALALCSTPITSTTAASVVAAGWVLTALLVDRLTNDPLAAFGAIGHLVLATVALGSALIIAGRHAAYERPTSI